MHIFPHPVSRYDDISEETRSAILGVSGEGNFKLYHYVNPKYPNSLSEGYIGVTGRAINRRHRDHLKDTQRHLSRPLSEHLLKNREVLPVALACGSKEEINELEIRLRPEPNLGWNIHSGGGASGKGQKNVKAGTRGGLEVHTPLGTFKSRQRAAEIHNVSVSTVSRRCNSSAPKNDDWAWHNTFTDDCVILTGDPALDIARCVEALHKALHF